MDDKHVGMNHFEKQFAKALDDMSVDYTFLKEPVPIEFTASDALSELVALVSASGRPEGEGWYSTREIAEAADIDMETLRKRLEGRLRRGEVEKRVCGVAYWRVIQKLG